MQTLLLPGPQSGRDETGFRSDRNIKTPGSLAGTTLAGRYKISKTIDLANFKAHDLVLDQTVTVWEALLTSQRDRDIWRQKAQQLALVRNPNFLNVVGVVSERSSDFVISEHPRGNSVAELLSERSRFDAEEVLSLMTPLAEALDLAASFACYPNLISAYALYTEARPCVAMNSQYGSLSECPPFRIRMDVGELLKPRKNIASSFLTSKMPNGGLKRLAVRQAALLTYELLGGDTQGETEVKRRFKPVNQLGKAGNSILCHGLEGSARFKTNESFFHELELAIRSHPRKSKGWQSRVLQTREYSVAYAGTNDVLRRFNRDTRCLVAGLLVVFTALAFAALVPERHPKMADPIKAASQVKPGSLLNADLAASFRNRDMNASRSTSQAASGTAVDVDQGRDEISSKENLMRMEAAAGVTPASGPVWASRLLAPANGSEWAPAHRQDSARAVRTKIPQQKYRSLARFRDVDVKMRLIALWHQSLRHEKSRNWTLFSNSKKRGGEKVSYTAETRH